MKALFDAAQLGAVSLRNRCVRSATHEGYADAEGHVTDALFSYVERVAQGGAGLVITGHAYVAQAGKASPGQLAVTDSGCDKGLSRLASGIQRAGAAIFLQLAHAGQAARQKISGKQPVGPTTIHDPSGNDCCGMDSAMIEKTRNAFCAAAVRAKRTGFDGVQIHAAHGYLLSQFLSPYYNRRSDEYGGSVENRARLLVEITRAIKEQCGARFPVCVKMNSEDFLQGGYTVNDMLVVASLLEDAGVDAIELSGGTLDSQELTPIRRGDLSAPTDEVYYREACARYKERVSVPLIVVGGIRSPGVAQALVTMNLADFVALSRPLIREPALINEWRDGRTQRAQCISCNACFRPLMAGKGLYCVIDKRQREV